MPSRKPKHPGGRPRRAATAADRRLEIRATDEEIERWTRAAGGDKVSTWARDLLNAASKGV